jgi:Mg-chelatase subunit ChlD
VDELLRLNGFDPDADSQVVVTPRFGTWDETQRAFVETAFRDADAIQVNIEDRGVPAFFGVALGHDQYTVGALATAGSSQLAPLDVVLVLDCSESMSATMANGRTRMQNTHDAAVRLIGQLRDDDRVGLAVFSWEDHSRKQYERTGTIETKLQFNLEPTEVRVNQLRAGHYVNRGLGTNIGGGLRAGLDVFLHHGQPRDAESAEIVERVMVLLTDGQVNLAEPYPVPDSGETGVAPAPPYRRSYDPKESVRQWSSTIKARGIKLYVVTVSDEGFDPLMATVSSPPDDRQTSYYYHVADGASDYLELMDVFEAIGGHGRKAKLLQ